VIVFLNGEFVEADQAKVSVFDRSFLYGDGVFETIRVSQGNPFRWAQHLERLGLGARRLHMPLPIDASKLAGALAELVRLNNAPEGVARLTLSRGVGPRGYSPRGADQPLMVLSLHPAAPLSPSPAQWGLATATLRLSNHDPLSPWKTGNKLVQILARHEAEAGGADEALLLNQQNELCEASSGNLFWIKDSSLHTPAANTGLLPGITRSVILELAPSLGLTVEESHAPPQALNEATGTFLTLSSAGIIEVIALDKTPLRTSTTTQSLYEAYRRLQAAETGGSP
jgi:aminodeoxychorismate lyase